MVQGRLKALINEEKYNASNKSPAALYKTNANFNITKFA